MDKYEIHEFDPQIYPRKLWVVINPDYDKLNELFEDKIEPLPDRTEARVISNNGRVDTGYGGMLIIFKNREVITPNFVTHESIHVALDILRYIDFVLDYDNQEPITYLAGWVAKCIYEAANYKTQDPPSEDLATNNHTPSSEELDQQMPNIPEKPEYLWKCTNCNYEDFKPRGRKSVYTCPSCKCDRSLIYML